MNSLNKYYLFKMHKINKNINYYLNKAGPYLYNHKIIKLYTRSGDIVCYLY